MKWLRYAALPVFLASATLGADPVKDDPNEVDQRFRSHRWFRHYNWRGDEDDGNVGDREPPNEADQRFRRRIWWSEDEDDKKIEARDNLDVDQRYRVRTWFRPGSWRQEDEEGDDGNDGAQPPKEGQPPNEVDQRFRPRVWFRSGRWRQEDNEGDDGNDNTQPPKEGQPLPPNEGKRPPM